MVTMDETWLYHYDSETKQQSICWSKRVTPPQEITSENSRLDFCDQGNILLIDYLPRCQTINAEYYSTLLAEIKDSLKGKRLGNFTNIVCVCTKILQLTGQLQPRRNWPTLSSSFSIIHAVLWIYLGRTTTCSLH